MLLKFDRTMKVNITMRLGVLPPHPGPLPLGEGESHPVFFVRGAIILFKRCMTGSLSPGERVGVRGKGPPKCQPPFPPRAS